MFCYVFWIFLFNDFHGVVIVNLNSLNNDYVSSFSWSSTGKDYQGVNLPDGEVIEVDKTVP